MAEIINVRVKDNTKDIMQAVDDKIKLALGLMGEVVEGYAKDDCPVDTGLLRNSITYAVSGQGTATTSYHASYGSNRSKSGKRISAGNKNAGSVRVGRYAGTIGNASENACYVGSNVEYAPVVEFKDISHKVGKAHFLRDAGHNHIDELKDVAQKALSRK